MTSITVYDDTAEEIERVADDNGMSTAEIISYLMDYIEQVKNDNDLA